MDSRSSVSAMASAGIFAAQPQAKTDPPYSVILLFHSPQARPDSLIPTGPIEQSAQTRPDAVKLAFGLLAQYGDAVKQWYIYEDGIEIATGPGGEDQRTANLVMLAPSIKEKLRIYEGATEGGKQAICRAIAAQTGAAYETVRSYADRDTSNMRTMPANAHRTPREGGEGVGAGNDTAGVADAPETPQGKTGAYPAHTVVAANAIYAELAPDETGEYRTEDYGAEMAAGVQNKIEELRKVLDERERKSQWAADYYAGRNPDPDPIHAALRAGLRNASGKSKPKFKAGGRR